MQWTATVRSSGGKARTVKQGTKLRLSRTGSYVLRVTAKDRSGNTASKTVRFRVVRKLPLVDGPTCYVGPRHGRLDAAPPLDLGADRSVTIANRVWSVGMRTVPRAALPAMTGQA